MGRRLSKIWRVSLPFVCPLMMSSDIWGGTLPKKPIKVDCAVCTRGSYIWSDRVLIKIDLVRTLY